MGIYSVGINLINQLVFTENCDELNNAYKIIITSDGVHEFLSLDELEDLLNEDIPVNKICGNIIEKAALNGSTDDRSIIIILK